MKAKFNWMDGLILLVLIAIVAVGGLYLSGRNGGRTETVQKTVQVKVELTAVEKARAELPKVGDEVTIGEKEKMEVTVTAVEVTPAKTLGYDTLEGRVFESEVPEKYDVLLTMEGDGSENNNTVEINGTAIRVGEGAVMKHKNWAGYGFVLAVDTIEQ